MTEGRFPTHKKGKEHEAVVNFFFGGEGISENRGAVNLFANIFVVTSFKQFRLFSHRLFKLNPNLNDFFVNPRYLII